MRYLDHPHAAPVWKQSVASFLDGFPWLVFAIVPRVRASSTPHRVVTTLIRQVYAVAAPTMFGRTIGQRVCNIRVVSQEAGRSPTLKQSLVMWAVQQVPTLVLLWWPKSPQLKQSMATTKAFNVEIKELKQKHREDPEAKNRAIGALIQQQNDKFLRTRLPVFLRLALALAYGRMLTISRRRDPLNQGLAARRAKILLIDERPSSFPRLAALIGRREPVP